jgi:hypothetical protein
VTALLGLDPATYLPHDVHRMDSTYPETNCWTDVVIELLHARGDEPLAALGSTLSIDHEGDQFTFFKPRPEDLETLYGVDVHELQPYRPLLQHAVEQLRNARTLIVEADAWWLPDTAATSYHREHVKTAIAIEAVDADRLVYFHNGGLFSMTGEDRARVFAWDLPGYVEVVRFDAGPRLVGEELRATSRELLREHLLRRPERNPFSSFGDQLGAEVDELVQLDEVGIHAFAFATTRMAGAAAALAAAHVRWCVPGSGEAPAACLDRVAVATRTLTIRLVRRKPFDPVPLVAALAGDWAEAQERLDEIVG